MRFQDRQRLDACDETRLRIRRGELASGALSADEVHQMMAEYRALAQAGLAGGWLGLAMYHLDPKGLHRSTPDAAECLCRAVVGGSRDARDLLERVLPALRAELPCDPPHAGPASEIVARTLLEDRDGSVHCLAALLAYHGFGRTRDLEEAHGLFALASARGYGLATAMLAYLTHTGAGVPPDPARAQTLLARAEAQGVDVAEFREEQGF